MREKALHEVFDKIAGRCHFCGDRIVFKNRGYPKPEQRWVGHWEADHVFQRARGGKKEAENCLPACTRCNRLRWNRKGRDLRRLLLLGLISMQEIGKGSTTGERIKQLETKRVGENSKRRGFPI